MDCACKDFFVCVYHLHVCDSLYLIFQVGANVIVSGTALVKHDNPREAIQFMRATVNEAIQKSQLER